MAGWIETTVSRGEGFEYRKERDGVTTGWRKFKHILCPTVLAQKRWGSSQFSGLESLRIAVQSCHSIKV